MGTAVMITGASGGDTLAEIGRSYKPIFNNLGYELLEINMNNPNGLKAAFQELADDRNIDFAFSMMGLGNDIVGRFDDTKQFNLWEYLRTPFLTLCGDSPAYFFDRHVVRNPNFAVLYGFPEHFILRKRLPKINGMVGTIPPILLDTLSRDEVDVRRKTAGQLLFLKNGKDPEKIRERWRAWVPARALNALEEIASQLSLDLTDDRANQIDDIITEYFLDRGIQITNLVKLRLFFISQIDEYLRSLKSIMIARALMDFPVQLRGIDWEHLDFSGKRLTYVRDYDYRVSRGLIRESLGTIDMSPNTGLAPHDRVLRAYGCYTLCLANEQEFFRKEVAHSEDFSFRLEPEAIQSRVAEVLAHPARSVELGIAVAENFRKTHPPEAGIGRLIDIASLIRLNQWPERPPGAAGGLLWPPSSLA